MPIAIYNLKKYKDFRTRSNLYYHLYFQQTESEQTKPEQGDNDKLQNDDDDDDKPLDQKSTIEKLLEVVSYTPREG